MKEVLAAQRTDGGWSDLPSMESNAYATGQALFALHSAGLPPSDTAYERGVRLLLKKQQQDGSWYVRTRALGFQPYFERDSRTASTSGLCGWNKLGNDGAGCRFTKACPGGGYCFPYSLIIAVGPKTVLPRIATGGASEY